MIMFDGKTVTSHVLFRDFVDNDKVHIINKMRRTDERLNRLEDRYKFTIGKGGLERCLGEKFLSRRHK